MGQIWSLGEKIHIFREIFKIRMTVFDVLARSNLFYGVEMWVWKEWKEVEQIQD